MRRATCSRCGEEVRWGERKGQEAWWHRHDVDHVPVFGQMITSEMEAEIERQLDLPRERHAPTKTGFPLLFEIETYTTREFDINRMKKAAREAAEAEAEERGEEYIDNNREIPDPEVVAEPIEKSSEWLPGGAKTIWNLAEKNGWTIISASRSRGPRIHASHGTLLSISDFVLLKMRLDGSDRAAVASWTDREFKFAYNVTIDRAQSKLYPDKANSHGLKAWIKGETT